MVLFFVLTEGGGDGMSALKRLYPEGGGETGEKRGGYVGHKEFVWVLSSSFLHFLTFPQTLMTLDTVNTVNSRHLQLLISYALGPLPKAHNVTQDAYNGTRDF